MIYSGFPLVEIFVADGRTGIRGTVRGPRGPLKTLLRLPVGNVSNTETNCDIQFVLHVVVISMLGTLGPTIIGDKHRIEANNYLLQNAQQHIQG